MLFKVLYSGSSPILLFSSL